MTQRMSRKPSAPFGPTMNPSDLDLVDQVDPRESHELGERKGRDGEVEPAEPEGQRPDQRRRPAGDQATEDQRAVERSNPHIAVMAPPVNAPIPKYACCPNEICPVMRSRQ